jgi:Domain of unknown function (DUF6265)
MKKLFFSAIIFFALSAFMATGNNNKLFKKLFVLEGTWKMTTKRGAICEEWKIVNKNYLQNKGYMLKGTDTVVTERVALTKTGKEIFYTSTVEAQNNKQPISFKMTKATDSMFVFENPAHDFPKRIVYKIIAADSLHAWIDDGHDETKKRQNFYYKRQ